jgi:hypothetical protein
MQEINLIMAMVRQQYKIDIQVLKLCHFGQTWREVSVEVGKVRVLQGLRFSPMNRAAM